MGTKKVADVWVHTYEFVAERETNMIVYVRVRTYQCTNVIVYVRVRTYQCQCTGAVIVDGFLKSR